MASEYFLFFDLRLFICASRAEKLEIPSDASISFHAALTVACPV
jgi:hypothetical protein